MRCKVFLAAFIVLFLISFVPAPYLDSVYWNRTEASAGQPVRLNIEGRGLEGHEISFKIFERDEEGIDENIISTPSNIIYDSSRTYTTWVAEWQDDTDERQTNPPEYYFIVQVVGYSSSMTSSTVYADMLKVYTPGGSGAIWTTKGDCGNQFQDINHFAKREVVYINGKGFAPGTYNWDIIGNEGGSSGDPGITVASGTHTVDETGTFCFKAYTVALDDWGEYNVDFGEKKDNYRVDPDLEPICELTSATWSVTEALEGDLVRLNLEGTNCNEKTISFEVMEKDLLFYNHVRTEPVNIIYDSSRTYTTWVAEWQDDTGIEQTNPPEYYFIAEVEGGEDTIISSNKYEDMLKVYNKDETCAGINYCYQYLTKLDCEADLCDAGENSIPGTILCGESFNQETGCFDYTNCGCFWDNVREVCEGKWDTESKCFCDTNDECWLVGDHCEDDCTCEDGYDSNGDGTCGDNNPNVCVPYEDECWLAGDHCEDDCTCEDGYDSNGDGTCGEGYIFPGSCLYTDISQDTCEDDELLVRSQSALWVWAPGNEVLMYDPLGKHLKCKDIEEVFICPSKVQIPFFTIYQLVTAIAIIGLIYLKKHPKNKKK